VKQGTVGNVGVLVEFMFMLFLAQKVGSRSFTMKLLHPLAREN